MLPRQKFLARLFLKKTSRYCHSPGIVDGGIVVVNRNGKTLIFSKNFLNAATAEHWHPHAVLLF